MAAAAGSVLLGAGLAFVPARKGLMLGPIRSFALTASVAVVFAHLLPEAYEVLGGRALLVFGVGLMLPSLLGALAQRLDRGTQSSVGLEVGYAGLLLHHVGDGLSMGALSEHDHGGHGHSDVVIALASHTVPVAAMVVLAFGGSARKKASLSRALGLAVSGMLGVALGHVVSAGLEQITAWVAGLTAGMVLHVVVHDLKQNPPSSGVGRTLDLGFAVLGVSVGAIGAVGHAGEGSGRLRSVLSALLDLTYDAAPVLLLALVLAALIQARVPLALPRVNARVGATGAAAQGVVQAAQRPLAASGVLALGQSLGSAHPAQILGLMLAAPILGVDFALIALRFFGLALTLVALLSVLVMAFLAGAIFGRRSENRTENIGGRGAAALASDAPGLVLDLDLGGSFGARFRRAFEGLLDHLGVWMVVGLVLAAVVEVWVPSGSLSAGHPLLMLALVSVVCLPSYVWAASAVPVGAVAIAKGVPPGIVLAGLILGACLNLQGLRFFRTLLGLRRTLLLTLSVLLACWGLAWLVGHGVPVVGEHTLGEVAPHAPGFIGRAATLLCLVLLLRSVWWHGVRAWCAELAGGYAHSHHFARARVEVGTRTDSVR